jgi:hypothetical protein
MVRASPATRVSLFAVAARHVVCKEEHRRSPPSNMCRSAMAVENMYGWWMDCYSSEEEEERIYRKWMHHACNKI